MLNNLFKKLLPITLLLTVTACETSHEITIKQDKPLEINMNIRLEVSEEIIALLRAEKQGQSQQSSIRTKSISKSLTPLSSFDIVIQLKEAHMVGETNIGYISNTEGSLNDEDSNAVKVVNSKRKDEYQHLAQQKNISIKDVELIAGNKRIEDEQIERMVMSKTGQFILKK